MTTLKPKKQYAEMFPPPSPGTYQLMKSDIVKNGQITPIYHNKKGIILDGYTKIKILKELKLKPIIELKEFSTEIEEIDFIISMNEMRRHLTDGQRFLIYENHRQEILRLNKQHNNSTKSNTPSPHGQSSLVISKKSGISIKSVERLVYIINNGTKTDIQKLRNGEKVWPLFASIKNKIDKKNRDKEEEKVIKHIKTTQPEKQTTRKQKIVCPECGGRGHIWI